MGVTQMQQDELQALRREVEALRAERAAYSAGANAQDKQVNAGRGTMALLSADDIADDVVAGAKARFGDDWAELKQTAVDIAQEIEAAARERPVLGIASAFVVGLVLGRLLSR